MLDGALVLVGGVLLIVPGFITDVLGLLLLAPPTRALARRGIAAQPPAAGSSCRRPASVGPAPAYDVDSTASDIDRRTLPR